jgi:hypothetical protein
MAQVVECLPSNCEFNSQYRQCVCVCMYMYFSEYLEDEITHECSRVRKSKTLYSL